MGVLAWFGLVGSLGQDFQVSTLNSNDRTNYFSFGRWIVAVRLRSGTGIAWRTQEDSGISAPVATPAAAATYLRIHGHAVGVDSTVASSVSD
jgi:hypothetical protein